MSHRRPAQRRGGAHVVTFGVLSIGGSSFVLLAAGPRLLGESGFSGLGLIWTVATVFGIGIAIPTEQVIGRRMNAGSAQSSQPAYVLVALGAVASLLCLWFGSASAAADALPQLVAGMLVAIAGWVAVGIVRGRLAGCGDLTAYSAVLVVESGVRVLMVTAAFVVRSQADLLLSAAAGVPLLVGAAAGCFLRIDPPGQRPREARSAGSSEQLGFFVVAAAYQICLNGAPLLLEWRSGAKSATLVGEFVAASTYFRSASLVAGGIATHALVQLASFWGAGDHARFRRQRRASLTRALILTLAITVVLAVATPFALPAYYGGDIAVSPVILGALAASTVVAVMANVAVQSLLASGHARLAGGLWLVGAAVTSGLLGLSSGLDTLAAAALVAGPSAALLGAFFALRRVESSVGRDCDDVSITV